jgi:hypothetical protein
MAEAVDNFFALSAAEIFLSTQHRVQGILESTTRAGGSDPLCRPRQQQHCTTGFHGAFRQFIATSVPAYFAHFSPFFCPCHSLHRKLQQLSGLKVQLLSLPYGPRSQSWGLFLQIMSALFVLSNRIISFFFLVL